MTASVPAGTTSSSRSASTDWRHAVVGAHADRVEDAVLAEDLLRGLRVEVRRRGAAQALLVTEADGADDGELPGRALEEDLDGRAELDVVLLGAGRVDDHLVGPSGAVPDRSWTSPRRLSSLAIV